MRRFSDQLRQVLRDKNLSFAKLAKKMGKYDAYLSDHIAEGRGQATLARLELPYIVREVSSALGIVDPTSFDEYRALKDESHPIFALGEEELERHVSEATTLGPQRSKFSWEFRLAAVRKAREIEKQVHEEQDEEEEPPSYAKIAGDLNLEPRLLQKWIREMSNCEKGCAVVDFKKPVESGLTQGL